MKTKLFILALFVCGALNAQDFYGKAVYKTSRKSDVKLDSATVAANPGIEEQLKERMRKMFQKTFILNFNRTESIYKEDVKLDQPTTPQVGNGGVMVMSIGNGGGNDVYYKNIKENRIAEKADLMGKTFLIKDDIVQFDWKMTGETKNIGDYTVYKATYEREEESIRMTMEDGEPKEEKKMVKRTTVAWYTLDIPVSNGPRQFGGLPGLILEINDGNQTIVCTEIVLNPKDKPNIKEPEKGKVVTREAFDKITREKTKEMMEKYQGRGRRGGMQIRIGG
jgi:GLPGLI family protein